jgi:hypothetical protein
VQDEVSYACRNTVKDIIGGFDRMRYDPYPVRKEPSDQEAIVGVPLVAAYWPFAVLFSHFNTHNVAFALSINLLAVPSYQTILRAN